MRVLMVNSVCGIRSTGRICTDLAEILREYGHECKIAFGRESVPAKYQPISVRITGETEVKINALKARIFDNEGFNAKSSTRRLINLIEAYQPDLLHLHNLHGYYINLDMLFTYLADHKIPIVYTLHDCWTITGHCSHFAAQKCEKWKTGCRRCSHVNTYPASFGLVQAQRNWERKRQLFSRLDNLTIVTPSNWLAEVLKQSYLKARPIVTIPNGIDLDVFQPTASSFRERYGLQDNYIVLGVATAWDEEKGLSVFFQLQKELGHPFQVVLVGLTAKQLKKLPKDIIGIEKTNNVRELAGLYSTADIFVNAGQAETMGLTTVEAMACGTPAVVSNLTAVPEVVDDDGGVVFEEYSAPCIAGKIREVAAKKYPNTRSAAMKYEKRKQYNQYIALYEKIAGKGR